MESLSWEMIGTIIGGVSFLLALIVEWDNLGIRQRIIVSFIIGILAFLIVYLIAPRVFSPSNESPIETESVTTVTSSRTLLSENFSNTSSLWGYDTNLWTCIGCDNGSVTPKDGAIRFEVDGITQIDIFSKSSWPVNQVEFIQGRFMISEYNGANNGDLHLLLGTSIEDGWWQTACWIEGKQDSTKLSYSCTVEVIGADNKETYEYFSDHVSVNFGNWVTTKIELNPTTMELRFYFDDKLIGQHIPTDAKELNNKNLKAQFGVSSNNSSRHIVASVDDVLIVKSP